MQLGKPCPHCGKRVLGPTTALIVAHHKKGLRSYEIANKLLVSQALVCMTLRTLGIPANKRLRKNGSAGTHQ